jgi:hypothetical protein
MKYIHRISLLFIVFSALLTSCSTQYEKSYQFTYTFNEDQEGWVAGFADLPADYDPTFYALDSGWEKLPSGLEGSAIYLSGNNNSDDLFMFIQKQLTGLKPETTYLVQFDAELASNSPAGMMGIGGSPGESVYIKAGAVSHEPEVVSDSIDWLRLDIDKGNQASEGEDMINLGTIANPNIDPETQTGDEYALMRLDNQYVPFQVTSDKEGNIWVIVGSDSGFEGATAVYYNSINITLTEENQ